MSRKAAHILFWLTLLPLLGLMVWPIAQVVSGGLFEEGRFTFRFIAGVFRNPVYSRGLLNSLGIAVGATVLATLFSLPLAWIANRFDFPGKRLFSGLVLAPMILPPFVGAVGVAQMFGQYGAINTLFHLGPVDWIGNARVWGVILLEALGLYPIIYLNVSAALANIDPALEQAAENLGASLPRRFLTITFPLVLPGLFAGASIVFIWSFTELGTPLILNYQRCTPVQVFDALKEIGSNSFPFALVLVMLVASMALYLVARLLLGRSRGAMSSKASTAAVARRLRGARGALAALAFSAVIALALLPHIGVVLTAFAQPGSWYRSVVPEKFTLVNFKEALGHPLTAGSIRNSLIYASAAVLADMVAGIAIAWVVVRSKLRFRGLLDTIAMLPLAVPGLVLAFGYLAISSALTKQPSVKSNPFLMRILNVQEDPTLFLVVAYAVRRLPYMVRSAVAGLQQTPEMLEEAAHNLGASSLRTLRRVTGPLISANLVAGAMLAFAFSMLEVSDSIMLAQRQDHYPIAKTIYELFQLIGQGKYLASALGLWAMAFLGVTLLGASALLGKKMGAIFRV